MCIIANKCLFFISRELQKLLAEERSNRAKAEGNLEEMQRELLAMRSSVEVKEKELTTVLESLKHKLNNREKDSSSQMLASLQEEMNVLKQEHLLDVQKVFFKL